MSHIAHIPRDKSVALCGASIAHRFHLIDLEHAEACVREGTRVQPCAKCLKAARKRK